MRDRLTQVGAALQEAEDRLAELMREALETREYEDVAAIAAISGRLRGVAEGVVTDPDAALGESRMSRRSPKEEPLSKKGQRPRRQRGGYPRFMREGDRLVKVGWSKKEKAEYQHKAPKQAVEALLRALGNAGDEEFAMDALLPIANEQGEEVPSYQAYLGLAWLRSWGAVRRESRGGYSVQPKKLIDSEMVAQWQALPECDAEVAGV